MDPSAMDIDSSPPRPPGLLNSSPAVEFNRGSAPLQPSGRKPIKPVKPKTRSQILSYHPRIPPPRNPSDSALSTSKGRDQDKGDSSYSSDTKPSSRQSAKSQLPAPISSSASTEQILLIESQSIPNSLAMTSIRAAPSDQKHDRSHSSSSPVPDGTFRFKRCPPEIRNKIYALLVVSPGPLVVSSPRTGRQKREGAREPTMACAIMRVDKQISRESRAVFFAHNTFALGTGRYGAIYAANVHGLQVFTELMPRWSLRAITQLALHIYLPAGWLGEDLGGANRDFIELKHQEALETLGRVLDAEFPGVTTLTVEFVTDGPPNAKWGLPSRKWNERVQIAVDREQKLGALWNLVKKPGLQRVVLIQRGSQIVLTQFAKMVGAVHGLELFFEP
ncbi:hypothetical protein BUE80_DR010742 [Diplocarpon rosae]|nr:hypothetical protein BUE80_DR010742 [Diplocarpon rosae]